MSATHQLLGMMFVEGQSLRLKIRPVAATDFRSLIPIQAQPAQALEYLLQCPLNLTRLIGVLDADDELATSVAGEQPVEQSGSDVPDVRIPSWTGSVSNPDAFRAYGPPLSERLWPRTAKFTNPSHSNIINTRNLFGGRRWGT
jgi:hypothetical protein